MFLKSVFCRVKKRNPKQKNCREESQAVWG